MNFDLLHTTSSFQHMIKVNFLIGFQATTITTATVAHSLSFKTLSIITKSSQTLYDEKTIFPYSPFVNVYLEARIITIGAELTQF